MGLSAWRPPEVRERQKRCTAWTRRFRSADSTRIPQRWTGLTATVTQKPYVMAYYAIKFAVDSHHNAVHEFKDWRTAPAPAMPSWVDTGTVVVDKSNVKVFRDALASHP